MVAPESLTIDDIVAVLYKDKALALPLMRMDPWNDVQLKYIKQYDVPELDLAFAGRNWVTLAERIAYCVGDVDGDAVPPQAAPAPHAAVPLVEEEQDSAQADDEEGQDGDDAQGPDVPLIGGSAVRYGALAAGFSDVVMCVNCLEPDHAGLTVCARQRSLVSGDTVSHVD